MATIEDEAQSQPPTTTTFSEEHASQIPYHTTPQGCSVSLEDPPHPNNLQFSETEVPYHTIP